MEKEWTYSIEYTHPKYCVCVCVCRERKTGRKGGRVGEVGGRERERERWSNINNISRAVFNKQAGGQTAVDRDQHSTYITER